MTRKMNEGHATGQVHRFGPAVALYASPGTLYLTPKEARTFALGLLNCAEDCEARSFQDSVFHTAEYVFGDAER